MNSIRKWLYKPKKTDTSLLAQFYFADEELNRVATELDSFDSRKDPERCQALVTQLRACQDKVLTIVQRMMVEAIPYARTSRDFRVKFPDDVVQENLAGQLWFGAECLAAGSSIMNREAESASMRPLARALTKNLESLRHILRDQCLVNLSEYTGRIREALTIFDKLFAEFELSYVSAMVPVKTVKEYETIQEITVLFSETTIRAKSLGYITTDMIDEYSPALMFTIPRLAIVCGLLVFADGPLNPDSPSWNISDMFRPFQSLLYKIRELLFTLSDAELLTLERALCSQEEPNFLTASSSQGNTNLASGRSITTTVTTGVQTDSPVLKKVRANDDLSCSSLERLGSDCSDSMSLPEDADGTNSGEVIVCQSDKVADRPQSSADAVVYETEGGVIERETPHDGDNSSLRMQRNLNKSDSNDSGLHSDVVSTSDSQFTISSSDSNQLLSVSGMPSPLLSPSMDEVMELCMEQEDEPVSSTATSSCPESGGGEENGPGSVAEGDSMCADCGKAAGREEVTDSDQFLCDGIARSGEVLCDGTVGAVNNGSATEEEEESFHTPSSGLSPLHQPCANSAVLQAQALGTAVSQVTGAVQCLAVADSRASASSAFSRESVSLPEFSDITDHDTHVAGFSGCGIEDDMEEDSKCHSGSGSTDSVDGDNGESLQPIQVSRGNLQTVQTVYTCTDPSDASEVHSRSSSEAGNNFRDSSPTDSTITDQTPPSNTTLNDNSPADTTSTLTGLTPVYTTLNDTLLSVHTPEFDSDLASVHHASLSHCDTDSSSCTLQATCDNESQDQKTFSQSQPSCVSNSGVVNSNADFTSALNNEDASTTPVLGEINLDASQHQCDRCTQTPHSAINNDQSSKIHHHHHHHHHHRQHSNPSIASSASSLSSHSTPQGSAKHSKHEKPRDRGKRKDVPNTSRKKEISDSSRSEATSSQSVQSQAGKKRSVEKSQKSGSKKDPSSKARKTSHRPDSQKFRSVKSKRNAPESEARLKQYADNWSDCSTNSEGDAKESAKKKAKVPADDVETNSPSSSSEESSSTSDPESDQDSCGSSETSSYNSESHDDEEIALAVQAAELANRNQARARFRSSSDMIHRLFVCISGVADQLQTNFAGDLRNILRVVFNLNCSEPVVMEDEKSFCRYRRRGARFFHEQFGNDPSVNLGLRDAPAWIPDDQSTLCMSCKTPFTFVRRRHHCRNCGKIFCGRCSSNAVSLPHFGHSKPVRVCNHCFVFQVNPFAVQAHV